MSDIERAAFEQAVADKWSDSYKFTRFGDEDYYDEVLEGMWWGWQASREEGEPIGFLQSSGVSQLSGGHPAKLYPIGATPSPFESSTLVYTNPARDGQDSVAVVNKASTGGYEFYPSSNLVDIPNGMHKLYTHPASRQAVSVPEWIKCSDRLPDVLDVWIKMTDGSVVACWSKLDGDFYWNGGGSESYILENTVTHWKPRQQEKDHD